MTKTTKTPAEPVSAEAHLAELREAVGAAGVRRRDAGDRLAQAERAALALRDQRVLALSHDDEQEAAKVAKRIGDAERELADDLRPRVAAAEMTEQRAARDRDRFIAATFPRLLTEREPGDTAATERLDAALREVVAAEREWSARAAECSNLAAVAPLGDPRAVHRLPGGVGDVVRLTRRVIGAGPLPTPALGPRPAGWSIPDHDSPDDAVREAARAAMS